MSACCVTHSCPQWIEENKADFAPPVFADQLKVFFVGGPNQRNDYHLEEGEEVFYQIEGDMVLKVIEKGVPKDITIKQGEIFLLPARIEHSPQRYANTVGCVIERTRNDTELDCLRYFVPNTTEILWERWFHLKDVVKDLPPRIKEFFGSDEFKSNTPGEGSKTREAPFVPRQIALAPPINLNDFIEKHLGEINKAPYTLYGKPEYSTEVRIYGSGEHKLKTAEGEVIALTQRGTTQLKCGGRDESMEPFRIARVPPNTEFVLSVSDGVCVTVQMEPPQ